MKPLNQFARALIGFALVIFVFWELVPTGLGWTNLTGLLWASVAVQPFVVLATLFHAMRLGLLVGLPPFDIRCPLSAILLSQGFNLVFPGRIAEAFKATYLHAHAGVPLSKGIAAVFLERMVDSLIVAALGLTGIALLSTRNGWFSFGMAGLVVILLIFIPLFENRFLMLAKLLPWARLRAFAASFFVHIADTVRNGCFYSALGLGLATWATSFVNIVVFIQVADIKPVSMSGILILFVATTIGGAIPALPGGFGSYEAAAVLALKPFGYSLEESLPLAIMMHLSQFVIQVLGAVYVLSRERVGVSALIRQFHAQISKCDSDAE
ncbi:MAG: flippase-like domain-containing protein [Anaerolineales bacterium]|nr:flippase-like domain-containing protein [Anaerolineales bacterium]